MTTLPSNMIISFVKTADGMRESIRTSSDFIRLASQLKKGQKPSLIRVSVDSEFDPKEITFEKQSDNTYEMDYSDSINTKSDVGVSGMDIPSIIGSHFPVLNEILTMTGGRRRSTHRRRSLRKNRASSKGTSRRNRK